VANFEHLFVSLDVDSSASSMYNLNEFSLKGAPVARVSIRWGGTDYERRNYTCYYIDLPDPMDILEIGDWLLEEAIAKYGSDWIHDALMDLHFYLVNEFEVNASNHMNSDNPNYKLDDFGNGAKLCLLIALNNPTEWKRSAFRAALEDQVSDGVTGCHIDFVYDEELNSSGIQIRLLNSADNEPVYAIRGVRETTIIPIEILSYHQDFI